MDVKDVRGAFPKWRRCTRRALLCMFVLLLCAPFVYLAGRSYFVSRRSSAFASIEIGASEPLVFSLMGPPNKIRRSDDAIRFPGWRFDDGDKQLVYWVDSLIPGPVWVVTIDLQGRVVDKHRLS
jgi:hypothetical protein